MAQETILNNTLNDILNQNHNIPKSRTYKILNSMKKVFLGTLIGSGLILGINYFNHKRLQSNFKYEIKTEISNLVNQSISDEEIKKYVYSKIDSYLEENPNLISKKYKNSIDSLVNYFINEINDELKQYSIIKLNENSLNNSYNIASERKDHRTTFSSVSERIEQRAYQNTASDLYEHRTTFNTVSKRIEQRSNQNTTSERIEQRSTCNINSKRIEQKNRNTRIFFDNNGNTYLTYKVSLDKKIIRPIFDNQNRTYIVFDNTYERIPNNNSNLISNYKKVEKKYEKVDLVFYAYFNENENRTLIFNNRHEHINTIRGNDYTFKDLMKN